MSSANSKVKTAIHIFKFILQFWNLDYIVFFRKIKQLKIYSMRYFFLLLTEICSPVETEFWDPESISIQTQFNFFSVGFWTLLIVQSHFIFLPSIVKTRLFSVSAVVALLVADDKLVAFDDCEDGDFDLGVGILDLSK